MSWSYSHSIALNLLLLVGLRLDDDVFVHLLWNFISTGWPKYRAESVFVLKRASKSSTHDSHHSNHIRRKWHSNLIQIMIVQLVKIAELRQSCDIFCVHNFQETTFVCTIVTDNFCLHDYNGKHFKHCSYSYLLYALLQFPTFLWNNNFYMDYCNHYNKHHIITVIDFQLHNGNWQLFMRYWSWLLLCALLQLTAFVWTIATEDSCMLQTNNFSYINCNYVHYS